MTAAARRAASIRSLRQRRAARVRQHRSVRDIDAKLVPLVVTQLRSEIRQDKRKARQ